MRKDVLAGQEGPCPDREGVGDETILTHAGRDPRRQHGAVNPPVYRASTIVFETVDAYDRRKECFYDGISYGLYGTPTTFALAEAVARIEGGTKTVLTGSGTAAIALALTAFVKSGDHVLIADNAYQNTRTFCDTTLAGFGIQTTYYDPLIGAGIESLVKPNTRVIYMESPGSLTFEVMDVPAIATVARKHGIVTLIDNAWNGLRYVIGGVAVTLKAGSPPASGRAGAQAARINELDIASATRHIAVPASELPITKGAKTLAAPHVSAGWAARIEALTSPLSAVSAYETECGY